MATIKFSGFTNEAVDPATTELVGYKVGDSTANYRYSIAQIATGLSSSIPTIYTGNSSLTGLRTVTMGIYDLNFASTTAGQQVKFAQNVEVEGQGFTTFHTGADITEINFNQSNVQQAILASGTNDFDITPLTPKPGATYILVIKQPGSGGAGLVDWAAGSATVTWPAGTAPTLTVTNNAIDIITLICHSATGFYGSSTLDLR